MHTVVDSDFGLEVDDASENQVVIVNFSASWCGPCKAMKPQIEALEVATPGVKFAYCDVDNAPVQTERFGIMGVPTYIVLTNRKEHSRFSGSGPHVIPGIQNAISALGEEASSANC